MGRKSRTWNVNKNDNVNIDYYIINVFLIAILILMLEYIINEPPKILTIIYTLQKKKMLFPSIRFVSWCLFYTLENISGLITFNPPQLPLIYMLPPPITTNR